LLFSGFVVLQSVITFLGGIRAGIALHEELFHNIMKTPMSFFDTTPLGRILNRFSKDQNTIDETLPRHFQFYFRAVFNVIGILTIISYTSVYFIIAIFPLGLIYYFIQQYYLNTTRELRRIESVTRSPIYSHFSETLNGISSIRAYHQQNRFISLNESKINTNQMAYYPNISANRWLGVRLELLGSFVLLFPTLFAVISFGNIDSALVGLSVTSALSITITLTWMVRGSCDLEMSIISVERVKEYSQTVTEAPWKNGEKSLDKNWPQKGEIKFQSYSTRYREGLDLVLRRISCSIDGEMKIGCVGRTGAGKSSLTLALFRLIEPVEGKIIIDGEDIGTLGLHDVRSRLTIIPQDPVLFSGTIRDNLDPFAAYPDQKIWEVLESAHLKDYVKSLPDQLNAKVAQGGENLSVGQQQLICLGRALLRKTKILVLDEATASIDIETDDLIQKTIRQQFKDCTIVTIAHRINTIMDSDRIMVIDKGQIAEYDSPQNLLSKPSLFLALAKEAGLVV